MNSESIQNGYKRRVLGVDTHKSCAVFGHSEIIETVSLREETKRTLEDLVKQGYCYFYFGGFSMFDEMCREIVGELRVQYPQVMRIYCAPDRRYLRINKRPSWLKKEDYEEIIYIELEFDWWYNRLYYRNCAMVDRSDVVLIYVEERENSGAYKIYKYALRKKKKIINMFDQK